MSVRITGGRYRGRVLRTLRVAELRPTSDRVRSAIFSIIGRDAVEGAKTLDLYAGTGALGIEALSRGATWADFVESNPRLCAQIRESLRQLSLEGQGGVHRAPVEKALDTLSGGYGLVFADPPYGMASHLAALLERLGASALVSAGGLVVIERRFDTELAEKYGKLALWTSRRYGDTAISIYESDESQHT